MTDIRIFKMTPRQLFITSLWLGLGIKFLLAAVVPMTTDEVYFLIWAQHPDYGFYDHPPMVGWWLTALMWLADFDWWLRLPAILLSTILGVFIYRVLRDRDETAALLAAAAFLIAPTSLYNIFIATDTPMIILGVLSAWVFYLSEKQQRMDLAFYAGILLGLSFLSKYFAALMGLAFLAYVLVYQRNSRGFLKIVVVFIGVLPALALNLYWNYNHCWNNILFNFINRHNVESSAGNNLLLYLVMWLYLLTPVWFYYLYKQRSRLLCNNLVCRLFVVLSLVPLLLFLLMTSVAQIGLHWVMAFYPFIFIVSGLWFESRQLIGFYKWLLIFALLHVVLLLTIAITPYSFIKQNSPVYNNIVMAYETDELLSELEPYYDDYIMATTGYGTQAVMSYLSKHYFIIVGPGSKYARQDDQITDFRELDGKNILVFSAHANGAQGHAQFFDRFTTHNIEIKGAKMQYGLGQGFRYEVYREQVLKSIGRYYQIPSFLPRGQCYYYDRYFPNEVE